MSTNVYRAMIAVLVVIAALSSACSSAPITVEDFCDARQDSGCLDMAGLTYESCVAIEGSSWDRAEETGCQSVHQAGIACLMDEIAAGGCPAGGSSETCDAEIQAVVDCFDAP